MEAWVWMYVCVVSVVQMFAIVGNVLVIVSVVLFRKLRTVTNVLICNLAVSDILLGGFYMPQKLHDVSHAEFYHEGEALCKIVNFFPILVITSSCYTLVCVSFERRRAILEISRPQMTISQLYKLIPAIWIFSFIISFPTILEYSINKTTFTSPPRNVSVNSTSPCQLVCGNKTKPRAFVLFNGFMVLISSFVIPQLFLFNNYVQLARFVNRRAIQVRNGADAVGVENNSAQVNSHLFKNRIKLVKMLIIVAAVFAVSWFPFFVLFIYTKITNKDASIDDRSFLTITIMALAAFSTAYNVILYVIFNNNFKQAIKRILQCKFYETLNSAVSLPTKNVGQVRVICINVAAKSDE